MRKSTLVVDLHILLLVLYCSYQVGITTVPYILYNNKQ